MQYAGVFHGCKNDNLKLKIFEHFHIFAQNTYCGSTLEPPMGTHNGSVRGSPSGTIGNFTNGPIGSQWYQWHTNGTNCIIGRANGTTGITIGTNGTTNGTIGKTLNDIGIPLVPLGNPEHTQYMFYGKNKKIMYIPVNPSFTIYKWGVRGYKTHGHVILMHTKINDIFSTFRFPLVIVLYVGTYLDLTWKPAYCI